ncbi:restriction endonuclease subunit S [Methylobacterium bullatum]|uniref:Restriction enzyme BgcI subunit beta n=1 Tax=Methylobacterium bullatum TaxID=570505 RepID=A0AAV4Z7E0_9HYPH|nr:restriction endonuclease subunit S [Methylobacterium bullatum]MBD8902820.1 S-CspCI protein [Methylobacterium bullatum]GJD39920.1 Restriction enzyme BgcI subunit beta [Methylobacterium bullatum]
MGDLVRLKNLFHIEYGNQFDKNKLVELEGGINFVSRTRSNLGVDTRVEPVAGVAPYEAGLITVTMGGTYLLSAFVQPAAFYTGQNIKVLRPLKNMSFNEKVFYCAAISKNRYRYTSHGREANKTFDEILVPPFPDLPEWINGVSIQFPNTASASNKVVPLDLTKWSDFRYDEIFIIRKGFYNKKPPECVRNINSLPFIGATEYDNGVTSFCSLEDISNYARGGDIEIAPTIFGKVFPGKCVTVSNNGSVGFAFYQPLDFVCSHDVNPLYLIDREITPEIGLFLCAVIRMDRYRWSFGRKWRPSRMPQSVIKLPATLNGKPDWKFMEKYIKSLPYSVKI